MTERDSNPLLTACQTIRGSRAATCFLLIIFTLGWQLPGCAPRPDAHGSDIAIAGAAPFDFDSEQDHPATYNTVAVINIKTGQPLCTGSLISSNAVLTAKHCTFLPDGDYGIFFGNRLDPASTKNSKPEPSRVRQVVAVERLRPDLGEAFFPNFDLALMIFSDGVPASSGYRPLPLFFDLGILRELRDSGAYRAVIAGFGKKSATEEATGKGIKRILEVKLDGIHDQERHFSLLTVKSKPGSGACHGDSGGPLYLQIGDKWFIAGVTHGINLVLTPEALAYEELDHCAQGRSIYTFPGSYGSWVQETLSGGPWPTTALLTEPGNEPAPFHWEGGAPIDPWDFAAVCAHRNVSDPAWLTAAVLLKQLAFGQPNETIQKLYTDCSFAAARLAEMSEGIAQIQSELEVSRNSFKNLATANILNEHAAADEDKPITVDARALSGLSRLQKARLADIKVEHSEGLSGLRELRSLKAESVHFDGFSWLPHLRQLQDLAFSGLPDPASLAVGLSTADLPNLKKAAIRKIPTFNLGAIAHLASVEELVLDGAKAPDLSPLNALGSLKTLWLLDADLQTAESLCALKDLPRLRHLRLNNNPLQDLSALTCLPLLESLQIINTPLKTGAVVMDEANCPTSTPALAKVCSH